MSNLEIERKYRVSQDFALNFDLETDVTISTDMYVKKGDKGFFRMRSNSAGKCWATTKLKHLDSNETRKEIDTTLTPDQFNRLLGHHVLSSEIHAIVGSIVFVSKRIEMISHPHISSANDIAVPYVLSMYNFNGEWFAELEIDKGLFLFDDSVASIFESLETKYSLKNREHRSLYEIFFLGNPQKEFNDAK